jgi:hypothetical protein
VLFLTRLIQGINSKYVQLQTQKDYDLIIYFNKIEGPMLRRVWYIVFGKIVDLRKLTETIIDLIDVTKNVRIFYIKKLFFTNFFI